MRAASIIQRRSDDDLGLGAPQLSSDMAPINAGVIGKSLMVGRLCKRKIYVPT